MGTLNSETALLVALTVAVGIIALLFAFSNNVWSTTINSITGGESGPGIIDCDATTGRNCPGPQKEQSSFSINQERGKPEHV